MDGFGAAGFGPQHSMLANDPVRRARALKKAEPLSERLQECVHFLKCVQSIRLVHLNKSLFKAKSKYTFAIELTNGKTYEITRTGEKYEIIRKLIEEDTNTHFDLSKYGVRPCPYCKSIDTTPTKPAHVHEQLMAFVVAARQDRVNELHCDGIERVPSILATFLLRDVDQDALQWWESP